MNELDRLGAALKRAADELSEAEFRQCMVLVAASLQRILDTEREHDSERIVSAAIKKASRGGSVKIFDTCSYNVRPNQIFAHP